MHEILLVPKASCNLLSIQQLCTNNRVYVEFDQDKVKVCELDIDAVVVEGCVVEGLYQINLEVNKNPQALSTENSSGDL